MARYIKSNPKVAHFLGVTDRRNRTPDGNYLLWQNDMLKFGPLTQLASTLERIGAVALLPGEARKEQDGLRVYPLPEPTDPLFSTAKVEPAPEPTVEPSVEPSVEPTTEEEVSNE